MGRHDVPVVIVLFSVRTINLNDITQRSSQCSTTGVTKVMVCVTLSVGWWI